MTECAAKLILTGDVHNLEKLIANLNRRTTQEQFIQDMTRETTVYIKLVRQLVSGREIFPIVYRIVRP